MVEHQPSKLNVASSSLVFRLSSRHLEAKDSGLSILLHGFESRREEFMYNSTIIKIINILKFPPQSLNSNVYTFIKSYVFCFTFKHNNFYINCNIELNYNFSKYIKITFYSNECDIHLLKNEINYLNNFVCYTKNNSNYLELLIDIHGSYYNELINILILLSNKFEIIPSYYNEE